jgi:hypothetical protein
MPPFDGGGYHLSSIDVICSCRCSETVDNLTQQQHSARSSQNKRWKDQVLLQEDLSMNIAAIEQHNCDRSTAATFPLA